VRPGACLQTAARPLLLAFGIGTGRDGQSETVSYAGPECAWEKWGRASSLRWASRRMH